MFIKKVVSTKLLYTLLNKYVILATHLLNYFIYVSKSIIISWCILFANFLGHN